MTSGQEIENGQQLIDAVTRLGGKVARGIVEKRELHTDVEIRVSMRSQQYLGSIELFTLRKLEPADYHLYLVAIPRNRDGHNPPGQETP